MGGYGDLISAAIGGNTLELWPPPQEDMSVMLKPTFTATLGDGKESIVRYYYMIGLLAVYL